MPEVLLFHHAHGLTDGIRGFADELRSVGHTVHLPDLYDGQVFDELADGVRYAESTGFGTHIERGVAAAEGLSRKLVYAGFSLGVLPAQTLAQTRAGAVGALLFHSFVPPSELGVGWPQGVPVQVHGMDSDPFFVDEGDRDAARALVRETPDAELFLHRGSQHLFADKGLPSYDIVAGTLLTGRVLQFLKNVAGPTADTG